MRTAAFLNRMPPYLFAQIDAKRDAREAQGVDVISLGIGDPDTPTPPHIVDAMAEAIRNPANHRYPDYAGSRAYRTACALSLIHISRDPRQDVRSERGGGAFCGQLAGLAAHEQAMRVQMCIRDRS